MDLYSNNLIVILVANLLIFFASFLSLFFLRKKYFILFKKARLHEVEKKYYKPHFGPEETDENLDLEDARNVIRKEFIKKHLED